MAIVVIVMERFLAQLQDANPKHAPQEHILEHQDLALIVISVQKYFVATKRCEAYEKLLFFYSSEYIDLFVLSNSKYEAFQMKYLI